MHIDVPSVGHRLRATLWALCALGFAALLGIQSARAEDPAPPTLYIHAGSLAFGIADVIAVEGDPLADVTSLERVKFVAKGGKIYLPP
jgi:imidazolonepropionase-like amidohydrolase